MRNQTCLGRVVFLRIFGDFCGFLRERTKGEFQNPSSKFQIGGRLFWVSTARPFVFRLGLLFATCSLRIRRPFAAYLLLFAGIRCYSLVF